MTLARFKDAQAAADSGFAAALAELRAGRKRSHWIWYVFPQLAGLGRSGTAQFFALRDPAEAEAYLGDPLLRARLEEATAAVAAQLAAGVTLRQLMGSEIDALKLVSSLTLFEAIARRRAADDPTLAGFVGHCAAVLAAAAAQGCPRCTFTLGRLGEDGRAS